MASTDNKYNKDFVVIDIETILETNRGSQGNMRFTIARPKPHKWVTELRLTPMKS